MDLERRIEKKWKRLSISKVEINIFGKIADNKNDLTYRPSQLGYKLEKTLPL